MSYFDLWDNRDKLSQTLADGTPYGAVIMSVSTLMQALDADEYWRLVALDK